MFNSPRLIRRLISGASLAAAIVLSHASATEAAIAADQTVAPPVKLDLVSQGAAVSVAERTNQEQSATGKADDASVPPAHQAATAEVADARVTTGASLDAAPRTSPSADARPSRRARDLRTSRSPKPAEVHGDRCNGTWCGRQFVLMLGIGY